MTVICMIFLSIISFSQIMAITSRKKSEKTSDPFVAHDPSTNGALRENNELEYTLAPHLETVSQLRSATQQGEMSLSEAVARMTSLATPALGDSQGLCRRLVTLGGGCTCNFSDGENVSDSNVDWDRHVYGRRRVCVDMFLAPSSCHTLVVTQMTYNANLAMLNRSIERFGCEAPLLVVSPAELAELGGRRHWDLFDVMLLWGWEPVLSAVAAGDIRVGQVTYTAMLDAVQLMDEKQSAFSISNLQQHVGIAGKLERSGFSLLSAIPNPRCVHRVKKQLNTCLPISIDFTWIKN